MSGSPNVSFQQTHDNTRARGHQIHPFSTMDQACSDLGPQRIPPQTPRPGIQPPDTAPLPKSWASDQARVPPLSYLSSLEHCEPLKAFVRAMRGAATTIARPGSSLSCILYGKVSREAFLAHLAATGLPGSQAVLQAFSVSREFPEFPCDFFLNYGPFPENGTWPGFLDCHSQKSPGVLLPKGTMGTLPWRAPHSGEEGTLRW